MGRITSFGRSGVISATALAHGRKMIVPGAKLEDIQRAVEAPRFASYSLPDSFWPHPYDPGRLRLEPALAALVEPLAARGHRVALVAEESRFTMGGVCVVVRDPDTGLLGAGADPRRECYAAAR